MKLNRGRERVLCISDTQSPFHHPDTLPFLEALNKEIKPTRIVHIGDSLDQYALGNYIRDPEAMPITEEVKRSKEFLRQLYKLFPKAIEVDSNHNNRLFKRAMEAGIPKSFLKTYQEILESPWDYQARVTIDEVIYEHGEAYSGQTPYRSAAMANMQSTVHGHFHQSSGIAYISTREKMLFGMNVGCLIDNDSYAFAYNKNYKFFPTLACGAVLYGVPRLFPLILNGKGRWIKELI